ncbi:hypothetical protein LDB30_06025 [Acidithiobacillus ferrooxidans]|nr:hypothetical protein LDB30_06025 [Acidithiobacillus ferrooxidans]
MWMIRAENRYQVVRVDREVVTLSNRYGAEFDVEIAAVVASGYRLECEDAAIPVWWLDARGDVAPQPKPEPVLVQSVQSVKKDVFALFDF